MRTEKEIKEYFEELKTELVKSANCVKSLNERNYNEITAEKCMLEWVLGICSYKRKRRFYDFGELPDKYQIEEFTG